MGLAIAQCVIFGVMAISYSQQESRTSTELTFAILAAGVCVLSATSIFVLRRQRVEAHSAALSLCRPFGTRSIPWSRVVDVRDDIPVGWATRLVAELDDGEIVIIPLQPGHEGLLSYWHQLSSGASVRMRLVAPRWQSAAEVDFGSISDITTMVHLSAPQATICPQRSARRAARNRADAVRTPTGTAGCDQVPACCEARVPAYCSDPRMKSAPLCGPLLRPFMGLFEGLWWEHGNAADLQGQGQAE